MSRRFRLRSFLVADRQYGQALLVILVILGVAVTALVFYFANPGRLSIERDQKTAAALAQAKEALIGYAAADNNRPGSLPCPDTNNNGSSEIFVGADCSNYIGRLPWRTLGLPDLRDGNGERLWYAVSREFARNPSCLSACPLNSDTAGQITITGTAPAGNVIAIIFAPGLVTGSQVRSAANENTISNYLEGGNETGIATNTFVTGQATATFNDSLLAITSDALFSVVNIRVAKEAIAALESYRTVNSYYPFANSYGSASPYYCSPGLNRGRFPITLSGPCGQPDWGAALPNWFSTNNWNLVTHYAMSKACGQFLLSPFLAFLGPIIQGLCTTAGNLGSLGGVIIGLLGGDDPVTVTGVSTGVRVLVIVTGRAQGTQVHPCASADQCMEDASNTDGNSTYVKPSRFPTSNDRMAITCATSSPCSVLP